MMLKNSTITVIGLGYVGLPLAVEFGKKRPVIGFDIKTERIAELQAGHDRTLEVSVDELKEAKFLLLTSDASSLRASETCMADGAELPMVFIVTVPTPIDTTNRPDLTALEEASETVGKALKAGDVVIYESTVYPGATEEICIPILEKISGLQFIQKDLHEKNVKGFYCGYSPERINPGDKSRNLTKIKKVVSGSTPKITEEIDCLYSEIIVAGTFKTSSIRVAEAAKVIENSQRDLNIAFVNELSIIFERLGIDTGEVLDAAETKWNFLPFRPGLVGGHCIGVDPYYLTYKSEKMGYRPEVILAGRGINDKMGVYAAQMVIKKMIKNGINIIGSTVGVLGVTFKENCGDIRNSRVVDLIQELTSWQVNVVIVDPHANPAELQKEYGIKLANEFPEASLDSIVVAVSHKEFSNATGSELRSLCKPNIKPVIADLKGCFQLDELNLAGFTVFRL